MEAACDSCWSMIFQNDILGMNFLLGAQAVIDLRELTIEFDVR